MKTHAGRPEQHSTRDEILHTSTTYFRGGHDGGGVMGLLVSGVQATAANGRAVPTSTSSSRHNFSNAGTLNLHARLPSVRS